MGRRRTLRYLPPTSIGSDSRGSKRPSETAYWVTTAVPQRIIGSIVQ